MCFQPCDDTYCRGEPPCILVGPSLIASARIAESNSVPLDAENQRLPPRLDEGRRHRLALRAIRSPSSHAPRSRTACAAGAASIAELLANFDVTYRTGDGIVLVRLPDHMIASEGSTFCMSKPACKSTICRCAFFLAIHWITHGGRQEMKNRESHWILTNLEGRIEQGADAAQIADIVVSTWISVEIVLNPVIGQKSLASLYQRSIFLTNRVCPWLTNTSGGIESSMDFDALKNMLIQQGEAGAAAAGGTFLQMFYEMLSSLIGFALTETFLRSVLENNLRGSSAQDSRHDKPNDN